ncbi:MAG: glycosyltransferase family 2 protein [Prevotella sp.]|jgi:cellulose synthase/poly-beta-1,6-N-acetylglucosamine synthase-like glycosyltransferase|nr:glycosyltransferase family 2 protein [Prevotella sp.]
MLTLKIIFWICLALVFYTYLGYGIVLAILVAAKRLFSSRRLKYPLPSDIDLPEVTLMICAYNEEDIVTLKMENTHQLKYPKGKLKVMWVTDGTTDHTNQRLKAYDDVTVIFSPERKGKTAALNHGIRHVKTGLVVMTDANTMLNPDCIREVVHCFMDPKVGCVAGEKRVVARKKGETVAEGEGLYWKYESTLKKLDSELYSAMGAAGELCAIRTPLYREMPEDTLLDDFILSMLIVDEGYRIAYTPDAFAMEYGSADMREESKRKRRIAAGGLQSTWRLRKLFNPFRNPIVAFQLVSHRILRWTVTPFALLALIPLNLLLVILGGGIIYNVLLLLQLLFYLAALGGWLLARQGKKNKLLYIPYYFLFMNINVFRGMAYLRTHKTGGAWEKAKRG